MRNVKLILREAVSGLGDAGDLVQVKVGYARNYLLPQGKAVPATEAKVRELEHHRRVVMEKVAKEMKDLQVLRDRLLSVRLAVSARVGEEGRLFGSVTPAQIVELLAEKGFAIDRRKIALDEPIKEAGEHRVPIRLHRDVIAEVLVVVTAANQPPPAPGLDLQDEDELAGAADEGGEAGESAADAEEPATEE